MIKKLISLLLLCTLMVEPLEAISFPEKTRKIKFRRKNQGTPEQNDEKKEEQPLTNEQKEKITNKFLTENPSLAIDFFTKKLINDALYSMGHTTEKERNSFFEKIFNGLKKCRQAKLKNDDSDIQVCKDTWEEINGIRHFLETKENFDITQKLYALRYFYPYMIHPIHQKKLYRFYNADITTIYPFSD